MCTQFLAIAAKNITVKLSHPLKVRLEEHRKAVIRGKTLKSGMAERLWWGKGSRQPLWNEIKIPNRKDHWTVSLERISAYARL